MCNSVILLYVIVYLRAVQNVSSNSKEFVTLLAVLIYSPVMIISYIYCALHNRCGWSHNILILVLYSGSNYNNACNVILEVFMVIIFRSSYMLGFLYLFNVVQHPKYPAVNIWSNWTLNTCSWKQASACPFRYHKYIESFL